MNRRSFITKALAGLAAIPLIGKFAQAQPQTRQFVVGETGPELIIVSFGDAVIQRAVDAYSRSPRGRRSRLIT